MIGHYRETFCKRLLTQASRSNNMSPLTGTCPMISSVLRNVSCRSCWVSWQSADSELDFKDKFRVYHVSALFCCPGHWKLTPLIRQRKYSPEPRPFTGYETSAIVSLHLCAAQDHRHWLTLSHFQDIKSMAVLLTGVRESILRKELKDGDLIWLSVVFFRLSLIQVRFVNDIFYIMLASRSDNFAN